MAQNREYNATASNRSSYLPYDHLSCRSIDQLVVSQARDLTKWHPRSFLKKILLSKKYIPYPMVSPTTIEEINFMFSMDIPVGAASDVDKNMYILAIDRWAE
jgi:hypothetical protein